MSSYFIKPIASERAPERFLPLQVTPLMPNFAARIEGIDLTAPLSKDIQVKLREAWLRYGVLFFPNQPKLSPEQHLEIAAIFGVPDTGSPYVEKIGAQVDVLITDEKRPPITNFWHADNTTLAVPSFGTMIQIQTSPPIGGNTSWNCSRLAYECLSDKMKDYLEDLVAVHYWDGRGHREPTYLNTKRDMDSYLEKVRNNPPQEHKIVVNHPITGEKCLYVNELYTTYIAGVHRYESDAILNHLYNWCRLPEFNITHKWAENDMAVWDNYQMHHYGLADYAAYRFNQRVTFLPDFSADYGLSSEREAAFA